MVILLAAKCCRMPFIFTMAHTHTALASRGNVNSIELKESLSLLSLVAFGLRKDWTSQEISFNDTVTPHYEPLEEKTHSLNNIMVNGKPHSIQTENLLIYFLHFNGSSREYALTKLELLFYILTTHTFIITETIFPNPF